MNNDNHPMTNDVESVGRLAEAASRLRSEISRVIVGQEEAVDHLLIALIARGHSLLVGVPGLAKTLLVRTLSQALDLSFQRVQFTPDLMPGDITGTEVIEENRSTGGKVFRFIPGPLFANIVLADEINRTPPKTQSALLEAMQERRVTVAGQTYNLPHPFFVLATQNPIEQEGTYPLPEAQLDRFMFMLWLDYPTFAEEVQIVQRTTAALGGDPTPVLHASEIEEAQNLVRRVPVAENVVEYAVRLASATRPKTEGAPDFVREYVSYGAGPRASQYMILGAKARAILAGRFTPSVDDVRAMALPVLRHRVVTTFAAEAENVRPEEIVRRILESIAGGR